MPRRAYIESLLAGVPLPATKKVLIEYAKRQGDKQTAQTLERGLKVLSKKRFDTLNDVGEALEPVQPQWPRERRVPKPESGLPPGGPAYGRNGRSAQ